MIRRTFVASSHAPAGGPAASRRLALIDAAPPWDATPPGGEQFLKLVDVDLEEIVATAGAGDLPDVAMSPDGENIAVVSYRRHPANLRSRSLCLTVYDARTLRIRREGILPFEDKPRRFPLLDVRNLFGFSPDGSIAFIPSPAAPSDSIVKNDPPRPSMYYVPIRWDEGPGPDGRYRTCRDLKVVVTPDSGLTSILATVRWPRVEIADRKNNSIQVVDFGAGGRSTQYRLSDLTPDPSFARPSTNPGYCLGTTSGHFAYLVPEPADPRPLLAIDLTSGRPTVFGMSPRPRGDFSSLFAAAGRARSDVIYIAPNS